MKSAKFFIIFLFLLAFSWQAAAQKNQKAGTLTLSADDKIEIIKQIFDDGFLRLMKTPEGSAFQTCLIPLVENEKVVLISTEIEKEWVKPQIDGYRFVVMSKSRMQEQVRKEKGECYFLLTRFMVSGSNVKISLARYFNLPVYVHAVGFQYEFKKINGNWKRKLLRNYRIDS